MPDHLVQLPEPSGGPRDQATATIDQQLLATLVQNQQAQQRTLDTLVQALQNLQSNRESSSGLLASGAPPVGPAAAPAAHRPCSSTSLHLTLLTYIAVSLMRSLQAPQTHMAFSKSKAMMCMAVMTEPSFAIATTCRKWEEHSNDGVLGGRCLFRAAHSCIF